MRYYFLGICGTAMASLAILLKQKGHEVWGSDQNIYPPMSDLLAGNNIEVLEGFDTRNLKRPYDEVIIGNALTRGNPEIEAILNHKYPFVSLPAVIHREFVQSLKSIVITGTHGKTTCTSMLAWTLEKAGLSPTFLIGGVSRNFNTSARVGNGPYFVVEGDEYDCAFFDKRPKFIHYFPSYLMINNIEFDHADIYRDLDHIKNEFRKLIRIIPKNGFICANGDDRHVRDVLHSPYSQVQYFGKKTNNDWYFSEVEWDKKGTVFTVYHQSNFFYRFNIPQFGDHQIFNALGVIAVLSRLGLQPQQIQEGLESYSGTIRRLEFLGTYLKARVYDDFAHHPTAMLKTIQSLRNMHPNKKIIVIFEPRTNTSRRNILQNELKMALAEADLSLITPIHRLEQLQESERLSLDSLKRDLQKMGKQTILLTHYQQLWPELEKLLDEKTILVIMTNGSLGGEHQKLRKACESGSSI